MRAARVDANQPAIVKAMREEGASVTHLHKVGEGCPDLLVAAAGQWGLVEVKDGKKPPSARQRTEAQIRWWDANVNGGARAIVTDEEGARRFVRAMYAQRQQA